jgi:hypothetical protein
MVALFLLSFHMNMHNGEGKEIGTVRPSSFTDIRGKEELKEMEWRTRKDKKIYCKPHTHSWGFVMVECAHGVVGMFPACKHSRAEDFSPLPIAIPSKMSRYFFFKEGVVDKGHFS